MSTRFSPSQSTFSAPRFRPGQVDLGLLEGSSVPAMPAGALGVWYADQYQSSPKPHIPNEITRSTAVISTNILSGGRNLFGNLFTPINCNITPYFAAGPNSEVEGATRIATYSPGSYLQSRTINIPSASSAWCWMKSNTGSSQQIKAVGGLAAITHTVTTAWQRFKLQDFAAGTRTFFPFRAGDDVSSVDIQVAGIGWFLGSADLGSEELSGQMYLGATSYDAGTTYANGAINLSSAGRAYIQFEEPQTFNNAVTIIAVVAQVTAANDYPTILAGNKGAASICAHLAYNKGSLQWQYKSNLGYVQREPSLLFNGKGYHMIAQRYDGVSMDSFVNEMFWTTQARSNLGSVTIEDFVVGGFGGFNSNHNLHALALYDRALTDAEIRTAKNALAVRAGASGLITLTNMDRVLCAEGDSITAPYISTALQSYAYKYGANANPYAYTVVRAIAGHKVSDMVARAASVDGTMPPNKGSRKFILSVLIGANDFDAGLTTAQFLSQLTAYLAARRAAGWTIALGTILPRTASGFNAWRNTVNATISGWAGIHCDAIFDFAANTTVGRDGDAANTTYYSDGTHPTDACQVILETIYRPVINSL